MSPSVSTWLVLKKNPVRPKRGGLLVSIPKRVVRLSTRRSRLKRLIREAVRLKYGVRLPGGTLHFVVRSPAPRNLKRQDVSALVEKLVS